MCKSFLTSPQRLILSYKYVTTKLPGNKVSIIAFPNPGRNRSNADRGKEQKIQITPATKKNYSPYLTTERNPKVGWRW